MALGVACLCLHSGAARLPGPGLCDTPLLAAVGRGGGRPRRAANGGAGAGAPQLPAGFGGGRAAARGGAARLRGGGRRRGAW